LDASTTKFVVNLLDIIDKDSFEMTDTYRLFSCQIHLSQLAYLALVPNVESQSEIHQVNPEERTKVNLVLIKYRRTGIAIALINSLNTDDSHMKILKRVILYNVDHINTLGRILQTVLHDANKNHPAPYSFFTFNELTDMQIKTTNFSNPESEKNFSLTINWAHDLFKQENVTKLILKNHTGSYFCAKQFGKEVYFHKDPSTPFFEIEDTARETLQRDHNVTLI